MIAQNISGLWLSSDFEWKQKLQYLVFPEGVVYSKKNEAVRIGRINSLFAAIEPLKRDLEENEKEAVSKV
ncbi:hypothetical protein OCK74_20455 [Chitinophagaceae bacterium LB-8]|uniref:Uncharacterized protein n=1 Tax=Paraflavisolibacter caeni TaxID=2982496 RepID=A0A9X2XYE6_9BACT|nr:hypothetical protein [Paraflavisolibacter caeni]MCU7551505.1 hypothetical protein [Paraflavisolibacter caeni]